MHTFWRNSCLFHIITLLCTLNIVSPRLIGLRNWIQKLDEIELKEIDEACRPDSKLTAKNTIAGSERKIQSGPQNRIIDGNLAPVDEYPFVGVFVHADGHRTKCGATFITPRHMLTARHCFSGKHRNDPLLAAGVCHTVDNEDNCPNMDMIELDYELVMFDSWANGSTFGDIAIIQLTESVTEKYPGKISFACLPSSTEDLPLTVTLLGWGRHESNRFSSHLREAIVPVITVIEEYFLMAEPNTDTPDQGVDRGDSGSGGFDLDLDRPNRYVLHGVVIAGDWDESVGFRRSLMLKTSYFLDDLCHYIGLCSPTQSFENVFGLQTILNLDGVFIPQGSRSSIEKSVAPFKQISTDSASRIKHNCDNFRNMVLHTTDPCGLSTNSWSMIITNTENAILCDAVAVTDQHLITSRECIVPNLRRYHSGKASKTNIFVKKRHCPENGECVSWAIGFISWSLNHPLAIVQLVDSEILEDTPACFLSSKENGMDMSRGLRGYGKVAKLVDDTENYRYQICHQNASFCANQNKKCDQEPLSTNPTSGYGIMDIGSRTLAGIKISKLFQDDSTDVYWRTDNLIATLCIYLGRCDDESYSFLTKVSYFNNFYFMNDT